MDSNNLDKKSSLLEGIFNKKASILIVIGILARIFMLLYYYYTHTVDPNRSWGDMGSYYVENLTSTPLTIALLILFRILSFGKIEIFIFWGFFWDLLTCLIFYFVLKNFDIKQKNYMFGLFLINPFFFLTNSFSIENCGYHITDAFFLFFLLMAFIYYPKEKINARYLFYIFLGISMCIKYYTLPAVGFFFIKYLYERNWKDFKIFLVGVIPILILFFIIPLIIFDWFYNSLFNWYSLGVRTPLYLRIIPAASIFLLFILFRLHKSDHIEISILSIITLGTFMFFSYPYLRWFQAAIFYGILKEKEFSVINLKFGNIKREIEITNHILTFIFSIFAVVLAYFFILFVH
ncbi:MAG: hypothetical protein ACFFDN_32670 [Candidatus Hodarchaeota archaeon]